MASDPINRFARLGVAVLLVLAGVVLGARWAAGNDTESGEAAAQMGRVEAAGASQLTSVSTTTATLPPPPQTSVDSTTTSVPAPRVASPVTVTRVPLTTTTTTPTTTTTTRPPTTTTATPTTTTTTPTTTTTTPTTTTTTTPTTTTTTPTTTTTSTTTTTTTTTTVPEVRGLFVARFRAAAQGDPTDWDVRLTIDLGATTDGPRSAGVTVTWSGAETGEAVLTSGGGGRARDTLGPFTGESITFTITDVQGEGWEYLPELNQASTSVTVEAPEADDDD